MILFSHHHQQHQISRERRSKVVDKNRQLILAHWWWWWCCLHFFFSLVSFQRFLSYYVFFYFHFCFCFLHYLAPTSEWIRWREKNILEIELIGIICHHHHHTTHLEILRSSVKKKWNRIKSKSKKNRNPKA